MGKRNLIRLKRSLASFVDLFDVSAPGTHVGMITFNEDAKLLFDFKDHRYHSVDQLKEAIKEIPLKLKLESRTDLALTLAKERLFSLEGGDRPDVPNALIILTDGKSTGKPKQEGFVPIPQTVEILTKVGIHSFIHPSINASIYLFGVSDYYPSIDQSMDPSNHPPKHSHTHQPIHACMHISTQSFVYPSVCPSLRPSFEELF